MAAKWTYRPEYHLGDPAFSLFDGDDRAAVGLTLADAKAACVALNSHDALLEALKALVRHFEGDEDHDEGAFDPGCADCLALKAARAAIRQAEGGE